MKHETVLERGSGKSVISTSFQQLKLMAPFPAAEVHVSLKMQIARIILVIRDHNNPCCDLELHGPGEEPETNYEEVAANVVEAAMQLGLINGETKVAIVDLDAYMAQAGQA